MKNYIISIWIIACGNLNNSNAARTSLNPVAVEILFLEDFVKVDDKKRLERKTGPNYPM